jgi:hypothetical protein
MSELTPNTLDDMRFEPTAEARHGRSQQVWDEQGAREVSYFVSSTSHIPLTTWPGNGLCAN